MTKSRVLCTVNSPLSLLPRSSKQSLVATCIITQLVSVEKNLQMPAAQETGVLDPGTRVVPEDKTRCFPKHKLEPATLGMAGLTLQFPQNRFCLPGTGSDTHPRCTCCDHTALSREAHCGAFLTLSHIFYPY